MSVEHHDYKQSAPMLDEGYWEALLNEGEYAHTANPEKAVESPPSDTNINFETSSNTEIEYSEYDWDEIITITNSDTVITLNVIGYNRGGLLVEWKSIRGFVPASQLIDFSTTSALNGNPHHQSLINYVGNQLNLRVIEINKEKNRLILSERAAQVAAGKRATILSNLQCGDIVEGYVTNLCDFGAFVDLGGIEGLIHISELSWGRVGHPKNILDRNQHIEAYVLDVDQDAGRVALSVKRLRPDPWKSVHANYTINQIVEGIITNVVDFGAFACIEDGLEGLIHVSELAEGHFLHPRNVVNEGQVIRAKIIGIDGPARRLGLTLRIGK